MEIRNLITFVQVAELNSFTKAARALDYSQSTVSFQIRQLETELDCLLFERINHTLRLTEKGRELLEYAQQVRHLTDEFLQSKTDSQPVTGHVRIVTPDSVCEAMILDNYADFYARYPGITLKFATADTDDMFRILDHNEADVMLTLDAHVYHHDYVIAKEARVAMHFVAGANHPLAKKRTHTMQSLAAQPFLLTEKGMGYRRILDEELAKKSIQLQPALEIGRPDIIMRVLEHGQAVSFLPDFVTREAVGSGKLVLLNVPDVQVDIWQQLIYHRSKWMSRSLQTFIDYVSEHEFSR